MTHLFTTGRRAAAAGAVALVAAAALSACSSDKLLDAPDPDLINPANVANAEGADALALGAISRFNTATNSSDVNNGEGYFLMSGLLADEWKSANTFTQTQELDQRALRKLGTVTDNANVEGNYRNLNRARVAAITAIKALKQFRPTQAASIAQMYLLKGYSELYMAEGYCSGLTFGDASQADMGLGAQMTTEEALTVALSTLDSTLATLGTANDALAQRVRTAAQIGRGRVLLDLGQSHAADAAAAVASVPTSFKGFYLTFAQATGDNGIWSLNNSQRRYNVGDPTDLGLQGTPATIATIGTTLNALPFASAKDPRVPVTVTTAAAFDTKYPTAAQQIWATRDSAIYVATGVDARLIEAEAQLQQGQSAAYLATLNTLRATVAGLAPLTDPGSAAARVDQFFREKAFWQFSRGYRLGDLRRLVRQYGRDQATVYPAGTFFQTGGTYGTDVVLPLPQAEQNARADFKGCFDFKA